MDRRTNPFDELEEILDRMNRQFQGMGREFEESMGSSGLRTGGEMSLDVAERDDEYVVTVDLPGFEKDDIDVTLRENRLNVDAERETESEGGDEQYLRRERSQRSVSRTVTLPEPVDEDGVSAEYNNGVLTVTLPKTDGGEESHHIDVG